VPVNPVRSEGGAWEQQSGAATPRRCNLESNHPPTRHRTGGLPRTQLSRRGPGGRLHGPDDAQVEPRRTTALALAAAPASLCVCHEPTRRGWLLLTRVAVVRNRDRGRGRSCSTWISGCWMGSQPRGVRVIASRVSSSQPQLALAWPGARRGSGRRVSAFHAKAQVSPDHCGDAIWLRIVGPACRRVRSLSSAQGRGTGGHARDARGSRRAGLS
jgi:hypothetical protein